MAEPGVYVAFRYQAEQDEEASRREGRWVGKDVEYVDLTLPGGRTVIPLRVTDEVRDRYRTEYDAWKRGEEAPLEGMSVKEWPAITKSQAEEMWRLNVRTLEDLVSVPDPVLQQLGSGARSLQAKAKAWLDTARDAGATAEEVSFLRSQNAELAERVRELGDTVRALEAKTAEPKRKRARETKGASA